MAERGFFSYYRNSPPAKLDQLRKEQVTLIHRYGIGRLTRKETLLLFIRHAQSNGFEFRRWFEANIGAQWLGSEEAVALIATEGRIFGLVFSHEFARAFWKKGAQMNFIVPSTSYSRMNGKGQVVTINRKTFTRRTIKADVWKYHLRQLVLQDDPIRYLKRFLPTHEELKSPQDGLKGLSAAG